MKQRGMPHFITAHAGFGAAGGPQDKSEDNTLQSILRAANSGADVVELDVCRAIRSGKTVLVITHDVQAPPADALTLAQLLQLFASDFPQLRIQLDAKENNLILPMLEEIENSRFPWNRVIMAGDSSYECVCAAAPLIREKVKSGMEFWMNPDKISSYEEFTSDTERFIRKIKATGITPFTVNTSYKVLTDEVLETLNRAQIRVSVWTLNDRKTLEQQMRRGLYNITTRLALAIELKAEAEQKKDGR